jgi:membrane protein implicated in regulation of membrane protease activity
MDISASTLWWLLAGGAVAAELATGTFYLLMIALGFSAAAVAAHLGYTGSSQIVVAALVGGGTTALWHWKRARAPRSAPADQNRDVNLDVGERVRVSHWSADGTTRVQYRGSSWSARLQPGATPSTGEHRVAAVQGNSLVLTPCSRD